jgi:hypothetical protein
MIGEPGSDSWGGRVMGGVGLRKRLMGSAEVVVHEVQGNRMGVIFDLKRKTHSSTE